LEIEIGFRPGQRLWRIARFINGAYDAISFLAQVSRREAQALLLIAKAIKAGLTNEVANEGQALSPMKASCVCRLSSKPLRIRSVMW